MRRSGPPIEPRQLVERPREASCGYAPVVEVTDAQYRKLANLVYRLCGIHLGENKKELLKARLSKRLRQTGCRSVGEYLKLLERDTTGTELVGFLDCITTNKTDFFREPQHFDFLAREVLPAIEEICPRHEPLRIWSAACSTGEEPYTIAMVLMENRKLWEPRRVKILASDICTQALEQAAKGIYAMERVQRIPRPLLHKYFQRGVGKMEGFVRVRRELRELVEFRRINLIEPFNFDRPHHVIFCRNVMIYFDKPTQQRLVEKFHEALVDGGYLFVGHSESLTGIEHPFKFVRPAIYRKEGRS